MRTSLRTWLHGNVLIPLAYRVLGDNRCELIEGLCARDQWSPQQVTEHQARRLSWLLRRAAEHSPFWQQRFLEHCVSAGADDPFGEINKLPILTKDDVRANWKRMRCTHLAQRDLILDTSSGSTGMPITVYHSRSYRALHAAMHYRMRRWLGLRPGDPILAVRADSGHFSRRKRVLRAVRKFIERERLMDAFQLRTDGTMLELMRRAQRFRPVGVYGYVTALATIAKLSRAHDLAWPSVRVVTTTSEPLRQTDRETLGEAFGAPVFDRYGSREVLSVSMECRCGNRHIFADCNLVEFAPVAGSDGALQHIVVTPLDNDAMPMFRYRSGDTAAPLPGTCTCGSHLPMMTACEGRVCNNFVTRDGRLVHGVYFAFHFNFTELFRQFQFHQTTHEHIDLYVQPKIPITDAHHTFLNKICKRIRHDYDDLFQVQVHFVDEIPKTASGKHLYTVSDVLKHV